MKRGTADHGQDDWYDAYAEDSQALVDAVDALVAAGQAQPTPGLCTRSDIRALSRALRKARFDVREGCSAAPGGAAGGGG